MCWVDWIHDTQIWIETPFCKYHQEETKMCNGCSTVTCQCKPQRIPKVGEVWCWRDNPTKCTAIIKLIDSEYAFFERNFHGVKSAGAYTLQQFLAWYDPPKPKPRELYIQTTNGILLGDNGVGPSYKKEYADRYPKSKFVRFVEVLD